MTIKPLLRDLDIKVRWITPTSLIAAAIDQLARDDTSALLVSKDKRSIEGILSSRDIVLHLKKHKVLSDRHFVWDLMTKKVITCDVNEDVRKLEMLMIRNNVRHIPVTERGRPVAVVNIMDITRYRLLMAEKEAMQLRDYVAGNA